jgi:hypothetical protein
VRRFSPGITAVMVLVRKILNYVLQSFRRLYRRVVPVSLTDEQLSFIEENAAFWRNSSLGNQPGENAGYVLVIDDKHPLISYCNASFGAIVAQSKNLKILFATNLSSNDPRIHILSSYPNANFFFYPRGLRSIAMKISARAQAARLYRSIKTPGDLLDLKIDGIRFGDAIYDGVLAGGYATVDVVDRRVLHLLRRFYYFKACIKSIIKKYDIRTSVFGHIIGLRGSTFSRYLLQHNIEVLNRIGANQIIVKKLHTIKDIGKYGGRLEPEYFQMMLDNDEGTIPKLAEEHLENRFNQQVNNLGAALAFSKQKKTFADRKSFCSEYNLDPQKPIVFVMLHAFNDYPHSSFSKPMLFQDYYQWFIRTLDIAQTVTSVNWVFKEHPASKYYPTKDVNVNAIFEQVKFSHIRFISAQSDFNAHSIRNLAKAIITCIGTAGLEYSTQGIPCVLAGGEAWYGGFGFTTEPDSVQAYETCLRHIDQLQQLSYEQIRRARIVAYFTFCLHLDAKNNHFCPYFKFDEIKEWDAVQDSRLWKMAAAQFRDSRSLDSIRSQTREISSFVKDDSWTQYFDMSALPYIRTRNCKSIAEHAAAK